MTSLSKRYGTCIAAENTYLISLDRNTFNQIMRPFFMKRSHRKLEFLTKFDFIDAMNEQNLVRLINYQWKEVVLRKNSVIYKENDKVEFLYLVLLG